MKLRTRSAVAIVSEPPFLSRPTNLPSFTASRPNVLGARPRSVMKASISATRDACSALIRTENGIFPNLSMGNFLRDRQARPWDISPMTLVAEIERRMREVGFNAKQLSEKAGLNPTYVRDVIEGKSRDPAIHKVAKIAAALGCSLPDLWLASRAEPRGEFVHDPEEIAWLDLWRRMEVNTRGAVLASLQATVPVRRDDAA